MSLMMILVQQSTAQRCPVPLSFEQGYISKYFAMAKTIVSPYWKN